MPEIFAWHAMPAQEVVTSQKSRLAGLSIAEAKERLREHGENALPRPPRKRTWSFFFRQLQSPLMLVLAVAAAISISLGHQFDAGLIFAILLLNAFLGFFQEYRADRALAKLESHLEQTTNVRRGDALVSIPSRQVVAGDIVILGAGDKVTADARILGATTCAVNEAALTGESSEVLKQSEPVSQDTAAPDRRSMVFAGTTVVTGKCEAVVVATGGTTEFGRIAGMITGVTQEATPLQNELSRLSRVIIGVALLAASGIFILGYVRGLPLLSLFGIAAALAVAVVPEGLTVALTVILTTGMRRMLAKRALVRRLVAAETLGSVNVVCVDKTGTLTTGEMSVADVRPVDEAVFLSALKVFIDGKERGSAYSKSASQTAFVGYLATLPEAKDLPEPTIIEELPFDSSRKYAARLAEINNEQALYVLGAPEVLLAQCDVSDDALARLHATLKELTNRGLRVFFLAKKAGEQSALKSEAISDLSPVGFIGLEDPLRPQAAQAIGDALRAGIRVVMITGDHPETAASIARQIGLLKNAERIVTGQELTKMSEAELVKVAGEAVIFARVLPEQKVRIVRAYQAKNLAVAMTGDGVNDAPALRAAEIGIALGDGTDIAKETADMVLLDNNVQVIIEAIREGRLVYDNIRKVVAYLFTFSLSEVALIGGVLLLDLPVPLVAIHVLWINLVTDGLPAMALAGEQAESDIMQEPPRSHGEPIITPALRNFMFFAGSLSVITVLVLYAGAQWAHLANDVARTLAFFALGIDSLVSVYVLRALRRPGWSVRPLSNPALPVAVLVSLGLLLVPVFIPQLRAVFLLAPLTPTLVILLLGLVLLKIVLMEAGKWWALRPVRRA